MNFRRNIMKFRPVLCALFALALIPLSRANAADTLDLSKTYAAPTTFMAPASDEPKFKLGVVGGFAFPIGDLQNKEGLGTNNPLGSQYGIQLSYDLDKHNEIRGSVTYGNLPGTKWSNSQTTGDGYNVTQYLKNNYKALTIGGDWLYHFNTTENGLYSVLGASFTRASCDSSYSATMEGYPIQKASYSGSQNCLGLKAGLGYAFNKNVSLEGTYNYLNLNSDSGFSNGASYLGLAVVIKF
jgi:hypothetical protein